MYQSAPKFHRGGYTLIEILVALFVFAIATSLVSVSLIQAIKQRNVLDEKTKRFIEVQRAMTRMTQDIIQIVPKLTTGTGGIKEGSFVTKDGVLHFTRYGVANPDFVLNRSALQDVAYTLEGNTLIRQLVFDQKQPPLKRPLLDKVASFHWTFYDQNFGKYDIWPPTQGWREEIPKLVEFTIELEDLGVIKRMVMLANDKASFYVQTTS